jgi:tRNA-specific 2-thiouridylase
VLGQHAGLADFTIGQKKGLGLATGQRLYVLGLDAEANTVTVGGVAELEQSRLVAEAVNFIAGSPPAGPVRVEARIRHRHTPAPATVHALAGGRADVCFDEPQRAITPGQSVVFYQGDLVLGGGVIAG